MTPLTREQLDKLAEAESKLTCAPWCRSFMYGAIRHVMRNCDIECDHGEPCPEGAPDRYDGEALADLRNAAPALIAMARRGMELEDVLLGIASKGCRSAAALKIESCRAVSPDDSGAWCASCIAAKAIGYAP
jgi:hypothetical protein